MEGAKRSLSKPTTRKEPITSQILKKIYKHLIQSRSTLSLVNQQLITFMLLPYAGFLRCDEALKIRRHDIAFHNSYLALFLESSKTDVYRHERTVLIARTGTYMDPVFHLFKYLEMAKIHPKSEVYIFRAITSGPNSQAQWLRCTDRPISYTTIKDAILASLTSIGLDARRFSTHSLRAGGATSAANQGVTDRLFKVHGGWRSDNSKDRYVKDSIQRRLRVTLNLGI